MPPAPCLQASTKRHMRRWRRGISKRRQLLFKLRPVPRMLANAGCVWCSIGYSFLIVRADRRTVANGA